MKFDGFLKVYGYDKSDVVIPALTVGDSVSWTSITPSQHFTQPPPRYTDAGLIKRLEADGVGRPSTYASIVDTLLRRKYVIREKKAFEATEIGLMVSDYLSEHFCSLVNSSFTAKMESNLDEIASGNKDYSDILSNFYRSLELEIDKAKADKNRVIFKTGFSCTKCSSVMTKRISKDGDVFLGCSSWPNCDQTMSIDGKVKEEKEEVETGEECPSCGGILIIRESKRGKFAGCKSYPVCKYTASMSDDGKIIKKAPAKNTGVKCQKCKSGTMIERQGKYGKFYGCSKFPKCRSIMKSV